MTKPTNEEVMNALTLLAGLKPEDINLSTQSMLYHSIHQNYDVACTAEYVKENYKVTSEEAFSIAAEVRERMDDCDEYNSYEDEFVIAVTSERGVKKAEVLNIKTKIGQVQTERGLVYISKVFDTKEEAVANGYSYSFTSSELNADLYGKCLDDRGLRHEFACVTKTNS